ncbi:hypothetical protein [Ekhidna sp.]
MNKTELIAFLRDPHKLSEEQLDELEAIVNENPYFLSARLLLAKASKEQGHPKTKKRIASAAIYSTDRVLLKKYLNGNLFFLKEPAKIEEETVSSSATEVTKVSENRVTGKETADKSSTSENLQSKKSGRPPIESPKTEDSKVVRKEEQDKSDRTDKRPSALKSKEQKPQPEIPDVPSGELDSILDELQRDMVNLKASREKFAEVQQKIEEDDAVSEAVKKASNKDIEKKQEDIQIEKEASPEDLSTTEASKKSASEITMQILDAAKKAKEEVAREEAQAKEEVAREKAQEEEQLLKEDTKETEEKESEELVKTEESVEEFADEAAEITSDKRSDDTDTKPKSPKEEEDSDRPERVIREPRFSRFATRSYLKPPENIDPSVFEDKDEDKKSSETENASSAEKKDDESDKIKLPDLSKAKAVPRKNKRTKKSKESDETENSDAKEVGKQKDKPKSRTTKKKEVEESKESETPAKEEEKKSTKKTSVSSKKTTVKKTTTKSATKKATAKKDADKKTTTKKVAEKKSSDKKPVAKKASPKKTTTKKEGTKKSTKASGTKSKSTKNKEEKKDDGKGEPKSQKDLIDKFIKTSPTIKYQRQDEKTSEDLAEQSGAWDPNLASEYLAEIYLHQGNKKRAIEIYEALSLKYPEKKSYFADLISKIE